jgi:calcium permeable stress-gated cation channel
MSLSLTSPQHRLRASATTVLVTAIPRKWLTYEALDGLYDVFPGGIRNIWINRNFDELNDKVQLRDSLASKLEAAETSLIRDAKTKHLETLKKEAKASRKSQSKKEKKRLAAESDAVALQMADQPGLSSGNPHQAHTVCEVPLESMRSRILAIFL